MPSWRCSVNIVGANKVGLAAAALAGAVCALGDGFYVGGDVGLALPGGIESTRTNIGVPTNCDQWLGAATLLDGTAVPLPAAQCQPRALPAAANGFDLDRGLAGGVNVGMVRGALRLEAEYFHQRRDGEVLPLVVAGDPKQREFVRRDEEIGDVASHGVFLNAYYDFNAIGGAGRVRPYVGVGLGAARVDIDYAGTSIRNSDREVLLALGRNPNAAGTTSRADESLSDTLARWQLVAGADLALGERRSLTFKLRYGAAFDAFEAGGNPWRPLRGHESTVAPGGAPVRYDLSVEDLGGWAATIGLKAMLGD